MIEINSYGNEQIADAILKKTLDDLYLSAKQHKSVLVVNGESRQVMMAGEAKEIVSLICLGIKSIHTKIADRVNNIFADVIIESIVDFIHDDIVPSGD